MLEDLLYLKFDLKRKNNTFWSRLTVQFYTAVKSKSYLSLCVYYRNLYTTQVRKIARFHLKETVTNQDWYGNNPVEIIIA